MNRVIENVTRQLVDQELAGTSTRAFWTDPTDGSLYVFVVMTKDTMDRALANAAQAGLKKISKVTVVPGSLEKDKHYSLAIAQDQASVTVKILVKDRFRNEKVAFALSD